MREWSSKLATKARDIIAEGLAFFSFVLAMWVGAFLALTAPDAVAVFGAGAMVALAIYKRPASRFEARYVVSEMTIESMNANLDTVYAADVLNTLKDAARDYKARSQAEGEGA